MQAIVTKYVGPTNYRPGRVKATCGAGSTMVEWEHALNTDANHTAAAKALCEKMQWDGTWVSGGNPDQSGNTYVRVSAYLFPAFTMDEGPFYTLTEKAQEVLQG